MNSREFAGFMATLTRAVPRFAPDMSDKQTLGIWFQALGGLSIEDAAHVCAVAPRSLDVFPSIRQILELAGRGEQSDEEKGREVGERIWGGIVKFGYQVSEKGHARVKEYLGPIGVEVVRMQGGWNTICEMATNDNASTLKAQWRELGIVIARKGRAGQLEAPPDFAKLPEKARAALTAVDNKWGKQ